MAKKLRRIKFTLKTLAAAGIIYIVINSIKPIRYAASYSPRSGEPSVARIEGIIRDKKIPPKHLDDVVFLKLHENFFRYNSAEYNLRSGIIFVPDRNRNDPNFYLHESFANDVCHEAAHNIYPNLPQEAREKWEGYALRLLDANFRDWQYIGELKKLCQSAFKSEDTKEIESLSHQIALLYSYSILPAGFEKDYNIVIDIGEIKKVFDAEELFAQTYAAYLTAGNNEFNSKRKEIQIQLGMEKPELEYLLEEGTELMEKIISDERGAGVPSCLLLHPSADFFTIWLRHLNPIPILKVWETMLDKSAYKRRVSDLCHKYIREGKFLEKN